MRVMDYLYNQFLPQPIPGPFTSRLEVFQQLADWLSHLPHGWTFDFVDGENYVRFEVFCPHDISMGDEEIAREDSAKSSVGEKWDWFSSGVVLGCPVCEEEIFRSQREPVQPVLKTSPKAGRNEPCPCGSGKKYKKCCL